MQEVNRKRAIAIGLRARAPLVVRAGALVILVAAIVFVAISYYRLRNNKPFRLKSETPELSREIKGIVEGYEQKLMKGDRLYLWLRAARDVTFTDDHHELEQVNLAVYPPVGDKPEQIVATKAVWEPQKSVITFLGNVKVETKAALKVNTEAIAYDQTNEVADTDSPVSFERENVSGHSTGAIVYTKSKKLELKKDVEVTVSPAAPKDAKPNSNATRAKPVTIRSGAASYTPDEMRLIFAGGVTAEQGQDFMSGDTLHAMLNEQKHLQK